MGWDGTHSMAPLTVAMVMAMSDSVTVSMGELTMGVLILMFLVRLVDRSTCACVRLVRTRCAHATHTPHACMRPVAPPAQCSPLPHLVRSKVDVSRVEDHVVIGVADSLGEHLGGSEACEAAGGAMRIMA